jgi:putative transferase (TIGR04331 family)
MNRSRMIVFDHPGTTFLEAMAANVPSIMFLDPKHWDFRPEAQPYLDLLRRAGILYNTPQSAAQQVAGIYDQVDSWWFSETVQEARQRFANHFALNAPDWNRQWVEAINRELHEVQSRQQKESPR